MFFYSVFVGNMGMSEYTLFSVMGLEIEYMLVEANTLAISPKSDLILKALSDEDNFDEVKLGNMALSNELVMHVLELKAKKVFVRQK